MGIDAIIALIGSLVPVVNNVIGFINRTSAALQQNKEMTDEQFAALKSHIAAIDEPEYWKTDAEKAGG